MSIVAWLIFGLIVGVIANAIDPEPSRGGILGAIVLGVVGALVGGSISSIVTGVGITGFDLTSLVIAVIGSLVLLLIGRTLRRA